MEPVTHALTSVALGRVGLNKITHMATPMLLVSGLLADADWITRLGGAGAFLRGHRTATHSVIGTMIIAAAVAAAFWFAGRKFTKAHVAIVPALLICTVGAAAHLLLDMLNDYGVKLLWPFGAKWYAWDIAPSLDTWILVLLLAGLLLPELFGLILNEIGSKPKRDGRQRSAVVALVLVALFVSARALAHQRAIVLLDSRQYNGETPVNVAAFPRPSSPLGWSGVVATDNAILSLDVPLAPGAAFDPDAANVHFKPESSPPLTSAEKSLTAVEFLRFARFPLAQVETIGDGFRVTLRDMRFATEPSGRRGIIAVIDLNAQNFVTGERLEFDSSK